MDNTRNQPAIIVKDLYKSFRLPTEQYSGLKQVVVNVFKSKRGFTTQKVLNDVSFEIKKGEFLGIVGRNGSGKSTLLKLLAGIYVPDKGLVQINGTLTPFIELGVGFNPELTGRENVFLNGALLGFSRDDMAEMYDEIVEFAELERFMDQKLKNYSSGMQVRLAFSIAIRARSDILLIDEVLAVGDADFQKKCLGVFRSMKKEGRTIILVTHDMSNVEKFCDRALVVSDGHLTADTTPQKASTIYARLNIDESVKDVSSTTQNRWGSGGISIKKITINNFSRKSPVFNFGEDINIVIELEKDKKHQKKHFEIGLAFFNQDNVTVAGPNSSDLKLGEEDNIISYSLKNSPLQPGDYQVTVAVINPDIDEPFDFYDRAVSFHVVSDKPAQGIVALESGVWSTKI